MRDTGVVPKVVPARLFNEHAEQEEAARLEREQLLAAERQELEAEKQRLHAAEEEQQKSVNLDACVAWCPNVPKCMPLAAVFQVRTFCCVAVDAKLPSCGC
jgi:hypothetical protein